MVLVLKTPPRLIVRDCVVALSRKIDSQVGSPVASALGVGAPAEITLLLKELSELEELLLPPNEEPPWGMNSRQIALARLAITERRREAATDRDEKAKKTNDPDLRQSLDRKVESFDRLIREPWFQSAEIVKVPPLTKFLTLETVESSQPLKLPEPQFDEKFHVLQAGFLALPMLNYYRQAGERRGTATVVAHVDVDNLKDFNTKYGNTIVDSDLLPVLMGALEGFVFARGTAFRFGGDEYVLLLPNVDPPLVVPTLKGLVARIATLKYRYIEDPVTVSVGLCVLEPGTHLTNAEALERATAAQQFAKKQGRNRIASYIGTLFRDEDLVVVARSNSASPAGGEDREAVR